MAQIINTKFTVRFDTLENWSKSTLVLEKSEPAAVSIPTGNTSEGLSAPAIAIKIGDGEHTWNELPYIQSIAGDVHAWAKTDNLKDAVLTGYTKLTDTGSIAATDTFQKAISKLENELSGLHSDIENIADTNTTYVLAPGTADGTIKVTPSEGEAYEVSITGFNNTFGSVKYENSTLKFYHKSSDTEALATISLPKEQFLDTTKTQFVNSFAWSTSTYPGSTDPKLAGKPVLVLALQGEGDANPSYSFLNMEYLVDIYEGGTTNTAAVTINDQSITVDVKVSATAGNTITKNADGLFSKIHSSDSSVNISTANGTTDVKLTSVSTDLLTQGDDVILFNGGNATGW